MSDLFGVLVGAGLAGGVLLLVKRRQAAQEPPKGSTACEIAEAAAKQAGLPFSKSVCEGLLGLGSKIADALNVDKQSLEEAAARDELNKKLNGAIAVPNELASSYVKGSALRYQNGCEPFEGAPGWNKCASGTKSMWWADIRPQIHYQFTYPAYRTEAERQAAIAKIPHDGAHRSGDRVQLARGSFLTGNPDFAAPDPTTTQNGIGDRADGRWIGFVKGRRVTCPAGQAPALWTADGRPIRDQRDGVPPCAPNGVSSFTPSTTAPTTLVGTQPVHTELACGPGNTAPPGYTWDAGGFWRRLAVGELPNAGPCNPLTQPLTATTLGPISSSHGGRL